MKQRWGPPLLLGWFWRQLCGVLAPGEPEKKPVEKKHTELVKEEETEGHRDYVICPKPHMEVVAEAGLESKSHNSGPNSRLIYHCQWVEMKALTGVSALQDQGTGETALLDKTNQAVLSRQLSPFTLVQKAFFLASGTATD